MAKSIPRGVRAEAQEIVTFEHTLHMKAAGLGSESLKTTVFLSGAWISLTVVNSVERGIITPCGGLQMRSWLTGSFLDSDEKDPITGNTKFYIPPFCFNIWIWVICAWLSYKATRFAIRRLIVEWRPPEVVKRT